jgi:prolipoprotein diacylglyceryltransferase
MRQVLFHIGSYKVYSYAVMLFIDLIVGVIIVRHEVAKRGIPSSSVCFIAAVIALSSLLGGRLFYPAGAVADAMGLALPLCPAIARLP